MTHDFAKKKKGKSKSKPKTQVAGWVWMFTGVATGLFIAFIVYLAQVTPSMHQAALSEQGGEQGADRPTAQHKSAPKKTLSRIKPSDSGKGNKTRFDFYTLLPEREVVVPEAPALEVKAKYSYTLQAGSFRSHEDADRRRARLILLGMDVKIESSTGEEGSTWHRVLVGPFASRSKLAKARSTLINKGIDTLLLKRKVS